MTAQPRSYTMMAALADDNNRISYRPKLKQITGSVTASILLQQILYWWEKNGCKPFYKFAAPCPHEDYKEGDSWEEELGFSRSELEGALKKLGTKITKGVSKNEALLTNMLIWWTDRTRKTWYQLSPNIVEMRLRELYLCNVENPHYIEDAENPHYMETQESCITFNSTDTTADTTADTTVVEETPPDKVPLDDVTARCLLLLKKVKGFPRNQVDNALYLTELREEFSEVDAVEVCRQYELWHRDHPNKTSNYRSRLRNFFARASRSTGNVVPIKTKSPPLGKAPSGRPAYEDKALASFRELEQTLGGT